ncbi:hypothetical protein MCEMRE212_00211 [Candidatus Nanopelagicaceae bacterium]
MLLRKLLRFIREEDGSVESSLVLIPLLTLILIAAQLTVAIHGRNMEKIAAQDEASTRAISGNFKSSDTYLHIYSPDPNQNLDLVISHRKKPLPTLVPGLSKLTDSDMTTDVSGIAIVENQR